MQLTIVGYVLLPLSLIFIFRPTILLQLALIASVFQAASVIIFHIGGEPFGLSCDLAPGLLATGVLALDYRSLELQKSGRQVVRVILPMATFVVLALAGAVILPRLFAGQFEVWPQNTGPLNLPIALGPNSGNITQSLYLAANTALLALAGFFVSRPGTRHMVFVRAYLIGGYIAVVLVLWQFASKRFGLYYPFDLLYSNPRWAILTEQAFGNINRINGPFTEPAALSGYFAGIVFASLRLHLAGYRRFPVLPLLLLALFSMLLSTSTTGLVIATIAIAIIIMRSTKHSALAFDLTGVVAGVLALGIITYLVAPSVFANIQTVGSDILNEAVIDKSESFSALDRTTKDIDSVGVLVPSYGLGAGWGSVRSSSLIPGILGNSGIPGFILLCWFAVRADGLVRRARRIAPPGEAHMALDALSGSVLGTVCAALLSGPTINDIDFFLRLALMIGCAVRIRLDAAERAMAPATTPMLARSAPNAGAVPGMP